MSKSTTEFHPQVLLNLESVRPIPISPRKKHLANHYLPTGYAQLGSGYHVLAELGFSPLACLCYGSLYDDGFCTAGQLAKRLNRSRSSVYHALQELTQSEFAVKLTWTGTGIVSRYRAELLKIAFPKLASRWQHYLTPLLVNQHQTELQRALEGRDEWFLIAVAQAEAEAAADRSSQPS